MSVTPSYLEDDDDGRDVVSCFLRFSCIERFKFNVCYRSDEKLKTTSLRVNEQG